MPRVIYYQSAFNFQKEKLNILTEMLEISKTGWISRGELSLQELLSELTNANTFRRGKRRLRSEEEIQKEMVLSKFKVDLTVT